MRRRHFLAATAGLAAAPLAMPRLARAQGARSLNFVPQTDVAILDPTATTAAVTRNHGFMVFDTLYGLDAQYRPQPQMAAGHTISADGLTWRITLRDGLRFHDNTQVLASDCVASIRRWAAKDGFGGALMAVTNELSAPDDKTIQFRLKRPFPLLPDALGKVGSYVPFIMPARLAADPSGGVLKEITGSGPFRFKADEHVSGSRLVYERFTGYVPRTDGTPSQTAGPKVANLDRVEWHVMPDPATSSAALQSGEVDWWEAPTNDLVPLLARNRDIRIAVLDPLGEIAIMRFNQLHPPFDNPAIRRALLGAVNQADYMSVVAGDDRSLWHDNVGIWCPGTPYASQAGLAPLTGPRDLGAVKAALKAAGYTGQHVAFMAPADSPETSALSDVAVDMLKQAGMVVDFQASDLGTVMHRRISTAPVAQGGWDAFVTRFPSLDLSSPATNLLLRGNGSHAWPGWPNDPEMESLRDQWFEAPDQASQMQLATRMQEHAMQTVPYLPLGQYGRKTGHRTNITGMLTGLPIFWNLKKA